MKFLLRTFVKLRTNKQNTGYEFCDHNKYKFGNYKQIYSLVYCKSGQELRGTKCGAVGCHKIFGYKKIKNTNDDGNNDEVYIEYVHL